MELVHATDMADERIIKVVSPDGWTSFLTREEYQEFFFDRATNTPERKKPKAVSTRSTSGAELPYSDPWQNLLFLIKGKAIKHQRQRQLLNFIWSAKEDGITLDKLQQLIGDDDPNRTSGTLAGITRNAKKAGFVAGDIAYKPKKTGRLWMAGPLLLSKSKEEIPDP